MSAKDVKVAKVAKKRLFQQLVFASFAPFVDMLFALLENGMDFPAVIRRRSATLAR